MANTDKCGKKVHQYQNQRFNKKISSLFLKRPYSIKIPKSTNQTNKVKYNIHCNVYSLLCMHSLCKMYVKRTSVQLFVFINRISQFQRETTIHAHIHTQEVIKSCQFTWPACLWEEATQAPARPAGDWPSCHRVIAFQCCTGERSIHLPIVYTKHCPCRCKGNPSLMPK